MPAPGSREDDKPRSVVSLAVLGLLATVCLAALLALGTWQVHRRTWKLDLIARVDSRVHATASTAPGPSAWSGITAAADEYSHVDVTGTFLDGQDTLVQAVTDYGPGFWDLVPFRTRAGWTVLINRGFVPPDWHDAARPAGTTGAETTVSGLLRMTEPGGGFLRHNDPAGDHWYSRDASAIAARRGLGTVAPYFIDADGPAQPGQYPIGGLTVVTFPNSHLVYALTWYGMALLLAGAIAWMAREEWRKRRGGVSRAGR